MRDRRRRKYFSVSASKWMHLILIKLREARWKQCIVEYELSIAWKKEWVMYQEYGKDYDIVLNIR